MDDKQTIDRLSAQNAQMREALEHAKMSLCGNCACADDTCSTIDAIDAALSAEPIEWHNPADTARIAELEAQRRDALRLLAAISWQGGGSITVDHKTLIEAPLNGALEIHRDPVNGSMTCRIAD